MNQTMITYASLIGALLLLRIPFIGKILRVTNTLVHESGHMLVALFTGGKVIKVELFSDVSGTTQTTNSSTFSGILTAISGYPFASFFAMVSAWLIHINQPKWIIIALMALALINLLFYVRNIYGFIWLVVFLFSTGWLSSKGTPNQIHITATGLMLILIADSTLSALELLVLAISQPNKSGDAKVLEKSTHIPAVIYGFIFSIISITATVISIWHFFPPIKDIFR